MKLIDQAKSNYGNACDVAEKYNKEDIKNKEDYFNSVVQSIKDEILIKSSLGKNRIVFKIEYNKFIDNIFLPKLVFLFIKEGFDVCGKFDNSFESYYVIEIKW